MARSRRERLPYRITRGGLLAVTTAFTLSLCLFWYGGRSFVDPLIPPIPGEFPTPPIPYGWWALFAGASLMGGALGAAIGQVFRDERGGAASMGVFIGVLAGPPIVVILCVSLMVGSWIWFGMPD
jgi:hypothetical protein